MVTDKRKIPADFKSNGNDKNYDEVFRLICANMKIDTEGDNFVYFLDEDYVMDTTKGFRWENLTPDYEKIVKYGLVDLKYKSDEMTNDFCRSFNLVIDNLIVLANRIIDEIKAKSSDDKRLLYFEKLIDQPADGFIDAIQRMLFVNQMFWQTDHRLTGLGAWDAILKPYYEKDLQKGNITKEEALDVIRDLFRTLHKYYTFKSNVLMGDTGQIFVIGKSDIDGNHAENQLTEMFIDAMRLEHQSDPKCLLRVNKNTPRHIIETALKSIVTGIGAPLLADDDVVIPSILDFGIPIEDAVDWTTSACWEPLIAGKSSSMNNMAVLNYLKALNNLLHRERLEKIKSFDELIERYLYYLKLDINLTKRIIAPLRHEYDPLLSVFMDGCKQQKKDVSRGGAKYHNVGITTVAMGNLINSLMNIKKYVFEENRYSLYDVKRMVITDFEDCEDVRTMLRNNESYYGRDDEDIIRITNRITKFVSEEIAEWRSYLGGRMKVGLSGSAYLDAAVGFEASFDGRKKGEPFVVHISNEDNDGYTQIVNFASCMKYKDSRFNGNVVDYMVSPSFIEDNWDKYVDFLMASIRAGFFEMQMNVVSSETLIEARKKPEDFPNLIVRVWGFSAYFKDLPDEYKDVLIQRTLKNEKKRVKSVL